MLCLINYFFVVWVIASNTLDTKEILRYICILSRAKDISRFRFMVFNATFKNISKSPRWVMCLSQWFNLVCPRLYCRMSNWILKSMINNLYIFPSVFTPDNIYYQVASVILTYFKMTSLFRFVNKPSIYFFVYIYILLYSHWHLRPSYI